MGSPTIAQARADRPRPPKPDAYAWTALANTTAAIFMASLDGSVVIIALPAIFKGINLDPLSAGNISYLLWMIMGYRLVQAVLVVNLGKLGDMFGRVKMYNAGFVVFTIASILLSFDPFQAAHGAMWLIGWRFLQAIGGAMLMANSAAILTDAFPPERRGFALGTNQIAALAGMFIGLVLGGLLAAWDWRAVFWINLPVGVFGTLWAYLKLRDNGVRHRGKIDWWGNITFALGLGSVLVGVTYGIQPYGDNSMGWESPVVLGELIGGIVVLIIFLIIETRVAEPMFRLSLFKIREFTAGNLAGLLVSIARGGIQFMLIIWLQGIWLPLHGYSYEQTPLWAGILMLPMTAGFLVSGPTSGILSDRFGSRGIATAGMAVFASSFILLMLLPVNFPFWAFALIIALNGIGSGMFVSPNSSSIMGSVPARDRGSASGMRSTFQNSGTAVSIGVVFTLMIAGLSSSLPTTLANGLTRVGVPTDVAHQVATLPPVSSLFASVLGVNPIQHLLAPSGVLTQLPAASQAALTGRTFFPSLISGPFHSGLVVVFSVSAVLSVLAGLASLLRGKRNSERPASPGPEAESVPRPAAGPDGSATASQLS
ncbi:MFS transporter [Trebonia kvetii]|uniref:MFS transporter n=1 Tax=Trebonia kvetii TaxID=2480626 RepID=A0A6P2C5K1_9ACTN|nr:MFS transporter [Trebonia kvetii]TVZ04793.1 MFS transporter [Trebonia kvetii]